MTSAAPTGLPLGFHEWVPTAQAAVLGLLTLVQEDVPTVGAALLAAAGNLPWEAAFLGCFLGIWLGDALLYAVARGAGRPLMEHSWLRRFFDPVAVARSERWFSRQGTWLLLSSRFVPGTRLPTYLAAGFLRLPFGQFLLVTGTAVALWTLGIFTVAKWAGPELLDWLERWSGGSWGVVLLLIAIVVLLRVAARLLRHGFRRRCRAMLGRWRRWEFWPAWCFYLPVALHYLVLALRYRSLTLPTAANPGIVSGGMVGESKMATLRELMAIAPEFTAEAHLLESGPAPDRIASLEQLRRRHRIEFPFILKPDLGQRGLGVRLIRTSEQAGDYLRQTDAPLVVQRYVPGPREVGIFYYRFPEEPCGKIFAITEKIFPTVTGDGRRTLEELIWQDERARFIAAKYLRRLHGRRAEVLPAGEELRLVEAGNHAQGCIFRDGAWLWSPELERRVDDISRRLNGFFIGRYDLRYASPSDLRAGRNFQIVELNGASSEATNIYDARNSVFAAYRTLFRQWELVFAIGAANRARGVRPSSLKTLWRQRRAFLAYAATYPPAD